MRKFCLLSTLVLTLLLDVTVKGQDISNKGKEFWLCFPAHTPSSGLAQMALFITSDKNSSGTISVGTYNITFTVTANQIAGPYDIPYSVAHLTQTPTNAPWMVAAKGIHVKVDDGKSPIVVFAHIYAGFRSEASLILPVAALGRKYYSTNFWQASTAGSLSQFQVVATEPNTVVKYQLRKNGGNLNPAQTVTLNNPGDVLQVRDAADLTGSLIESIASGTGPCKKIAVFSGSSSLSISSPGCTGAFSYDPLFQQCYPVNTWGKNFGVVPLANNSNGYHVRVIASEDNTIVNFNGMNIPLNAGRCYPPVSSAPTPYTTPLVISSDKPISVAQYMMSSNCSGSASWPGQTNPQGDPDMIILNPVEQSISDISIFSSNLQDIHTKYLNVYMKTTAASSFKINGAAPTSSFVPMPSGNGYSYLVENLTNYTTQSFRLTADDGFNAITYGMGDAESYGYSAGTSVKDFLQFVSVGNEYSNVEGTTTACKGAPYYLSVSFPYQPTQIVWQFNGLFPDITDNNPVFTSTSVRDGKTVYKYTLSSPFNTNTPGTYPIKVTAQNPTPDGCGGTQEIEYDLEVLDLPMADFTISANSCLSSTVSFTDNSTSNRPVTHRYWNFGDGNSEEDVLNPSHTYTAANNYSVKYTLINEAGCKADTVIKTVTLNPAAAADFTVTAPYCKDKSLTFKDASSIASGSITKWTWNFGDGSQPVVATTAADQAHIFASTGVFTITLEVETASGCTFSQTHDITVAPSPVVDFTLPTAVCLPSGAAQFNNLSTISDGTESQFTYSWDFGDGSALSTLPSPAHNYTSATPINVSLTVTSDNGCISTQTKPLTPYAEPVADFTVPAEICLGAVLSPVDKSTAAGSTVSQWIWDFNDGSTPQNVQSPSYTYTTAEPHTITLTVTSAAGCQTVNNITTKPVVVNQLPAADFTTSLPGCAGQDVTFTNASLPNSGTITKWTWDFGDGNTIILSNGNSFTHNYSSVGTPVIMLQVETDKGCVSPPTTKDLVIHAVPAAGFAPPDICITDVLPFNEASTISSGAVTGWQWNFGDANAVPANPNTSQLQSPSHHYTVAGDYAVQLIAVSDAGCRDTIEHTFHVNGPVDVADFSLENTAALCSNKDIVIKDASEVSDGNIIRTEISWDAVNDPANKTIDNDPAIGKTYTHTYPEFGSPAAKDYTIRYDVYSGTSCVKTITHTITLLATPSLSQPSAAAIPVCSNDPALQMPQPQLQNGLPGAGIFSGPGVNETGLFDPDAASDGLNTITYTYTGDNSCVNSITQTIEVYPAPVADAGPSKVVLEGGTVTLSPDLITGIPVTYSWSPQQWLNNPSVSNAVVTGLTADVTFTLTVTSDKGCVSTDQVVVTLLKSPVVPNIFSPNGDGIHDKWEIEHLDSYPGCVVQIYNRYGQLVYKIINYTNPWDGKINGKDAPIGTYYYIIDPKNGKKPLTGYIDIIR